MNIEEAKCSIGREIKFNNTEKLSKHWQETIQKSHKISILEQISTTIFRLIFKDKNNEIIDFWDIDFYEIDIELVDIVKGMTFEEAKLNTGKEVKFNNLEQLGEYWQRMIHKGYKVFIDDDDSEDAPYIKLIFKDKENHTIEFLIVDLTKIDISLKVTMKGMTIEEARLNIGAEVELLSFDSKGNKNVFANLTDKKLPNYSKLFIYRIICSIVNKHTLKVSLTSPEGHLYVVMPENIALKVDDGNNLAESIKPLVVKHNVEVASNRQGMTVEEAKLNIGKEIKFNDSEQFNNKYWQKLVSKADKVFIDDVINEKNIKVVFKDKDGEIILFWIFELDKFDISLVHNVQGMTIEEAKRYIGAEVELLEHTKPYMNNHSESVVNIESKNKPSKLIISDVIDGIVKVTSPEEHLYNLNPEHIALKVIKHLDIESVVLGDGDSLTDKIKKLALDAGFKLKKQKDGTMDLNTYVYDFARKLINEPLEEQRKPVHEWNVDDAFYANNHGEEVEVFDFDEWVSLDEITVGQARILDKFRIKPKQVFLEAGIYFEEDLLKIISDNFKK